MKYFFEYIQLILLHAKSKSHHDGGSWIFTFYSPVNNSIRTTKGEEYLQKRTLYHP